MQVVRQDFARLFAQQVGPTDIADKKKVAGKSQPGRFGASRFVVEQLRQVFESVTGRVKGFKFNLA